MKMFKVYTEAEERILNKINSDDPITKADIQALNKLNDRYIELLLEERYDVLKSKLNEVIHRTSVINF